MASTTCEHRNRWSRIKDFYREHPIAIALTYMPFYLLGFFLVEQLVEPRYITTVWWTTGSVL